MRVRHNMRSKTKFTRSRDGAKRLIPINLNEKRCNDERCSHVVRVTFYSESDQSLLSALFLESFHEVQSNCRLP